MLLVQHFVYYLIMFSGSCDILCFEKKCMYRKTNKIVSLQSSGPMRVLCTWGSCLMITICCVIVSMRWFPMCMMLPCNGSVSGV